MKRYSARTSRGKKRVASRAGRAYRGKGAGRFVPSRARSDEPTLAEAIKPYIEGLRKSKTFKP